jgi:hypothetical protein
VKVVQFAIENRYSCGPMSRATSCGSKFQRVRLGFVVALLGVWSGCAGTPAVKAPPAEVRAQDPALPAREVKGPAAKPKPEAVDVLRPGGVTAGDKTEAASPPPVGRDNRPPVEMTSLSERDWIAAVRQKIAQKLSVDPAEIRFSPTKRRAAVLHDPAAARAAQVAAAAEEKAKVSGKKAKATSPRRAPPRRYQIIVTDTEGKVEARFRTLTRPGSDEPPRDFRFLGDDSLIYEVVKPPADENDKPAKTTTRASRRRKGKVAKAVAAKPSEPEPEKRLIVIQPLGKRTRPIRCEHIHVAWNPQKTHIVSMGGPPQARFVAVDGVKVYPRRGASRLSGPPAWSKDGTSLAFVENRPTKPARLVLLAEFDNPTGDTFWDLPSAVALEGAQAYFTGHDRLVVGKSALRPLFAAPFTKEKEPSPTFDP